MDGPKPLESLPRVDVTYRSSTINIANSGYTSITHFETLGLVIGFDMGKLLCTMLLAIGSSHSFAQYSNVIATAGDLDDQSWTTLVNPITANGGVAATAAVAGANKVIDVQTEPYNAKCDGVTDDQAAIQSAFNAAGNTYSVQFPPGTCLTSTITWKGQPFFGAGENLTIIKGKPGQDVFQTPDGKTWNAPTSGTLVRDLKIFVDTTVDASADPNNPAALKTFPNRIAGTLGGTANPVNPAITPGQAAFGTYNGYATTCKGTITSDKPSTLTLSGCSSLTQMESWRVIGAPVTVKNAGAGGADLVTTIQGVTSNTISLASPALGNFGGVSGTYLNPITPPWYIGNCGFAIPNSDGSHPTPTLVRWTFRNVAIQSVGPQQANHSCGIFIQASDQSTHFDKVQINQLWAGYVEAYPALNPKGSTWTGDTTSYRDIDLVMDIIPFVIMGGQQRTFDGINIYGGTGQTQALGAFFLDPASSASISNLYFECNSTTTGEIERFTGAYSINIQKGSLDQCNPTHYIVWDASRSTVDAVISAMHIASGANMNTFVHTSNSGSTYTIDSGTGNSIETNGNSNPVVYPRSWYINRPQVPLNRLDAGWIFTGNYNAPYTSGNDLILTCQDFNFAVRQSGTAYLNHCVGDPSGTEITHGYFQATPTYYNMWGTPANRGYIPGTNGKFLIVGDRIPKALVIFMVMARCPAAACTQAYSISDRTTSKGIISNRVLTFGTTWTIQTIALDLSNIAVGDVLDVNLGTPSPWTAGTSELDTAFWAFAPVGPTISVSLTTTAATSDPVPIGSMTTSGHCSITATNASAATNIATTYITKAPGSITVNHTATAGMTFDIMCTPNY